MLGVGAAVFGLIVVSVIMLITPNGFQFLCIPVLFFAGLTAWMGYDYFNKLNAYKQGQANYWQRHEDIRRRYTEESG
jgi:FtsH-binding integral membrane protein